MIPMDGASTVFAAASIYHSSWAVHKSIFGHQIWGYSRETQPDPTGLFLVLSQHFISLLEVSDIISMT